MDKLKKLLRFIKSYPKWAVFILLNVYGVLWFTYTRAPMAATCTYEAVVGQGVPWDKWRVNLMKKECQYYNGTRWIPLLKVMDVGVGLDELEY